MLKKRLSALILLSFATMACTETKTSKPTPRVTMDAGESLNDSGSSMTDSGVTENPDSGMAMPGLLTVIAEVDGQALAAIDILLSRADGSFISNHKTDLNGRLEVEIDPDTTVTMLASYQEEPMEPQQYSRQTFVGINPGDTVRIGGNGESSIDYVYVGTASISYELPAMLDYDELVVFTGCDSRYLSASEAGSSGSFEIDLRGSCVSEQDQINVLGLLVKDEEVVSYASATDLDVMDVLSSSSAIHLSNWSSDYHDHEISLKNPRSGALGVSSEYQIFRKGLDYEYPEKFSLLMGQETTLTTPLPMNFADKYEINLMTIYGGGFGAPPDALTIYTKSINQPMPSNWELDLTADIVPPIFDAVLDRSGSGPWSVTWRVEGESTIADAYFGQVEWVDQDGEHDWIFLFPPDRVDRFQFPVIPNEFAQFRPAVTKPMIPFQLILFDASFVDGYSDFTANHFFELFGSGVPDGATLSASMGGEMR